MTTGPGEWSIHRIPEGMIGTLPRPIQRLTPPKTRATLEQVLLRAGAVLLCISIGGFGLARLARAGDERLWSEA